MNGISSKALFLGFFFRKPQQHHLPFLYFQTYPVYVYRGHQLEEDDEFKEFLSVHQNRSQVRTWVNDTMEQAVDHDSAKAKNKEKLAVDDYLNFDSDQSDDEYEEKEEEEGSEEDCK